MTVSEPDTEALRLLEVRIRQSAPTYFPQLTGQEVSVRFTPLRALGSNRLYRCELRSDGPPVHRAALVVKLATPSKPQRIEFDHLRLLHANRGRIPSALAVARPLDFFPDINALVTESVSGEQLSDLVLRKLHRFAPSAERKWIASRVRLSGEWLAHYHRLTEASDAPPFGDRWLGRATSTLQQLESHGFPRAASTAVVTVLSRLRELGARTRSPHAERHGDFGPHNIRVDTSTIYVFDFNDRRVECVYEDLARFCVWFDTAIHWPRYPLFDRQAAMAMKEDCIAGYFSESRATFSRVILEGYALAQLLSVYAARRRKLGQKVTPVLLPLFDAVQLKRSCRRRVLDRCRLLHRLLDSG